MSRSSQTAHILLSCYTYPSFIPSTIITQTHSPLYVILKTYHLSTYCPQRMLETLQFPQTTLTEKRWLFTCNPSTLRSSRLSDTRVRITSVLQDRQTLMSYSRMPSRPYESRQTAAQHQIRSSYGRRVLLCHCANPRPSVLRPFHTFSSRTRGLRISSTACFAGPKPMIEHRCR